MFLTNYDRRINLMGSLILIALILATGIFVFFIMQRQSAHILEMSLKALMQHEAYLIESKILAALDDTNAVASSGFLIESLQLANSDRVNVIQLHDLQQKADSMLLNGFLAVSIYDAQDSKVAQAGQTFLKPDENLDIGTHDAMSLLWFEDGFIQEIQMDVFDHEGQRIGRIVTVRKQSLVTRALNEKSVVGKSGEFMLCAPSEEDGLMMKCFLISASGIEFRQLLRVMEGKSLPMDYALKSIQGVAIAKDYRQISVVAAYTPIGEFGLGLVVKTDKEELYRPIADQKQIIAVFHVLLMAMGLTLLNWQVMPLVRKLVRSEQEIEKMNFNLRISNEAIKRNVTELINYNEAIGKLALVSVADREGYMIQVNPKFCEVSGYSQEEMLGQDYHMHNSGIHPNYFWAEMWETIRRGDTWHAEICNRNRTGEPYWLDSTIVPLKDDNGRICRYLSVGVDVTARKQREMALHQRLKESNCLRSIRHDMTFEHSMDKLCQQILVHLIAAVQFPEAASAKIELAGEQFVSANYKQDNVYRLEAEIIANGRNVGRLQLFYNQNKPFLCPEEQNLIDTISNDLSRWYERRQADQYVSYLATHDILTGLPNRHLLHDRITQTIAHGIRYRERVAILFIDLDRFKIINDSLGHDMGDLLLKETAIRLRSCVRSEDTVARQGGDEFIVLLKGVKDHQDAAFVAKKILESILQPYPISGMKLHIGCSIGIAIFPDDGKDADMLLKNSDIAMYHAKEIGRNNYQFFTPEMNRQILERHLLENDLHHALGHNEFQLYFQPVVDMPAQELKSLEVLLRWNHPRLGSVPTSKFILLAEETGMILSIGEWVLKETCLQIKNWQKQGFNVPRIAINLSARQFRQKTLVEDIARILNEVGILPDCLTLEITESMLIQNVEEAIEILKQLNRMGLELSIDDFGTGYSSLGYLKLYPINILKIDRSFIQNIVTDQSDAAITAAIIAMAKTLNMTVIAEGVETFEQVSFLMRQGCNRYQGFYFSEPVTAVELESKLRTIKSN